MAHNVTRLISLFLFFSLTITTLSHASSNAYRSPKHAEGAITASLLEARILFDAGVVFVDVRNPRFYARRHIPGAFHLDYKDVFDRSALLAIANKKQPIVIYCSGVKCSRAYRASKKAASWGFKNIHYFRGGIVEWRKAGHPMNEKKKPADS